MFLSYSNKYFQLFNGLQQSLSITITSLEQLKNAMFLFFFLLLVIIVLFLSFNILSVVILTKFQNQFFHVKSIRLGNLARSESNLLSRFHSDKSMRKIIFFAGLGSCNGAKIAGPDQSLLAHIEFSTNQYIISVWLFTFIKRLAASLLISIPCWTF